MKFPTISPSFALRIKTTLITSVWPTSKSITLSKVRKALAVTSNVGHTEVIGVVLILGANDGEFVGHFTHP